MSTGLYDDLLRPFEPPPTSFNVTIGNGSWKTVINVRTKKLHDSPYYLYSAYAPEISQPILELISCPSVDGLTDAYRSALHKQHPHRSKT